MHSRVIEISAKPLDPEDYLGESSIPEWFCGAIADYVDEETDRASDISWLLQQFQGTATYSEEDNSLCFDANAKRSFFAADYIRFRECLKELLSLTEEEFSGESRHRDLGMMMFHLKEAYSDKFGFYIYSEEHDLQTLPDWMRMIDLSQKYYIGGTLDYHF